MNRNRLYLLLFVVCLAGYLWLAYTLVPFGGSVEAHPGVCMIKQVTGVPCPSCGTTRAVAELFHGHVLSSLRWNPFGIIVALIMVVSPIWIGIDLLRGTDSLFRAYGATERFIGRRWPAIVLGGLVLANWIWNIVKGN